MVVKAFRIRVTGIVQGVGFRPFIHRIAMLAGVAGYVQNLGGSEVEIYVEGSVEKLARFFALFAQKLPPPARIEELEIEEAKPLNLPDFTIRRSSKRVSRRSMIPPDFAICRDCLAEILDPNNTRRYRYPFNSCAYCGPRFSMMYTTPYDRENTSMRYFSLCRECIEEYKNLWNERRYHAQGISCARCGPRVWLADSRGKTIEVDDPIREAAKLIDQGYIVGVKGLGGFHIAALATDDDVVAELRRRKKRPQKPFAIMALNTDVASKIVYVDELARRLLESPESPILLLPARPGARVSPLVAPGLDTLGVMVAYTGLHYLLLMETRDKYLIMTSGNVHGKPMCIDEGCAFSKLSNIVDFFLLHNREIVNRVDDSVARFTRGRVVLLRRSRGYAPAWIRLKFRLPKTVIAFGAELQNVGGIGFEDKVVLTQYIGDTDDLDTLYELDNYLRWFAKVYRVDPSESVLVADMHPAYQSRRLAEAWREEYGSELQLVQHHHAHIVSVMVDWGVGADERVVGIAIDGIGYGIDGAVWGGEVMLVGYTDFERVGHLAYQPMPGGDVATRYPVRMLIGILSNFLSEEETIELLKRVGALRGLRWGEEEARLAYRMAKKGSPITSSTGRVLDAVSALLGVCYERTYEGEPAIKLEAFGRRGKLVDSIEAPLRQSDGMLVVDTTSLVESAVSVLGDADPRDIAYTVMYRIGEALGRIAISALNRATVGDALYVSGGAAVNDIIVAGLEDVASAENVKIFLPRRIPAGDGGIALGQIAVVGARLLEERIW
ncbi:MAG TPA: carbamoyltransferase HypF [Pyrodictium sp.]|nr:carbamoyltransferase HypF [Pyrodictium sp.]